MEKEDSGYWGRGPVPGGALGEGVEKIHRPRRSKFTSSAENQGNNEVRPANKAAAGDPGRAPVNV